MHLFFWIVIAVLALLIIFKIVKKLAKLVITATAIAAIIFVLMIGLKYADNNNLREKVLGTDTKIINNPDEITGFVTIADETVDFEGITIEQDTIP